MQICEEISNKHENTNDKYLINSIAIYTAPSAQKCY